MISFAGLGEAFGGGEDAGVGESAGVGTVPGVEVAGDVEGLASGEFEAVWLVWVQPASSKTKPAAHAAGTARLLNRPSRTIRQLAAASQVDIHLRWARGAEVPGTTLRVHENQSQHCQGIRAHRNCDGDGDNSSLRGDRGARGQWWRPGA